MPHRSPRRILNHPLKCGMANLAPGGIDDLLRVVKNRLNGCNTGRPSSADSSPPAAWHHPDPDLKAQ
jgi:hypothetical protein